MTDEIDSKIQFLKEEILKEIRNSEMKNNNIQMQLQQDMEDKFYSMDKYMDENKSRFENIQDKDATFKIKIMENFPDLVKKAENNAEDIFTQNLRITKLENELTSTIKKYDKIISENLFVPGVIGDYCQFKNLKEYIEVIIIITYDVLPNTKQY